ncbi:MAG: alpha-ketoglutarate-dependent dioxygenase AlkB [Gammaproteobacteria bacterium]|jgi:alkylated DNA repair dioxygenase AlkB|nr:alpha-ketoglutarate-dependent dioxygenase AlkB [Gammaproteobacteria bacterium]
MRESRTARSRQLLPPQVIAFALPQAEIRLWPTFLDADDADRMMSRLLEEVPWRRDTVTVFGRAHPIPRLHSWHGDAGARYRWSGLTQVPQPWTPALAELRERLEACLNRRFNSVLANLYRHGRDHMGWHADDEPELGLQPVIASLSLGAQRDFLLRYRGAGAAVDTQRLALPPGSLLVMQGSTQEYWQHSLPRRLRVSDPRINLTFRTVRGSA